MSGLEAAASRPFAARARIALENEFLRKAVRFTADRLRNARAQAAQSKPDFEASREQARAVRTHTIANLDHYLEEFRRNFEARGGRLHFAADPGEARARVLEIARAAGARLVVKSKSMVSEELELNAHLALHGIEALETDLGEWVVQLAGELPAHIILPCIHKSRTQIRELFEQHKGGPLAEETAVLAGYARDALRSKFLEAELGLSGCNFAVAATGSIALFTNEGNGRMVTTVPRVHVALLGLERIVPELSDLALMAELLPRSATGQKLTTYLNLLSGPRRPGEADGPDELHVVVVDNGRSRQLGDRDLQEILNCIRCGACLNVCPVYRQVGGHAYGSVYPGPIGAVLSPLLDTRGEFTDELPKASTLCGACHAVCPVKIPLHDMLVRLRERSASRAPWTRRLATRVLARVLASAFWLEAAGRAARCLQRCSVGDGGRFRPFHRLVPPLAAWTGERRLPPAAHGSFRKQWRSKRSHS